MECAVLMVYIAHNYLPTKFPEANQNITMQDISSDGYYKIVYVNTSSFSLVVEHEIWLLVFEQ